MASHCPAHSITSAIQNLDPQWQRNVVSPYGNEPRCTPTFSRCVSPRSAGTTTDGCDVVLSCRPPPAMCQRADGTVVRRASGTVSGSHVAHVASLASENVHSTNRLPGGFSGLVCATPRIPQESKLTGNICFFTARYFLSALQYLKDLTDSALFLSS